MGLGLAAELRFPMTALGLRPKNQTLIQTAEGFSGAMTSLRSVVLEPGWIAAVIATGHTGDELRFRCFGAKNIVDELNPAPAYELIGTAGSLPKIC
ncbi:hypothetical protein SAMN02982922_0146 [Mesorhizobium australicum]|uniref:Uncharacterized protein n=1 Tax=Mesorhizobium australicum TaxID=536018 RepID=A0A1X7MQA3_9HYPH|nr:hypothetical protein SAMN02982922_0146 [Mesorhizobium australicum]